jgi:hypothetical protein
MQGYSYFKGYGGTNYFLNFFCPLFFRRDVGFSFLKCHLLKMFKRQEKEGVKINNIFPTAKRNLEMLYIISSYIFYIQNVDFATL